jgi:hypothetical protein
MRTKNQEPAKISMGHLVKRDTCFSRPQAKRVGGAPAIMHWRALVFSPLTRGGSERIESATLGILHVLWQQVASLYQV